VNPIFDVNLKILELAGVSVRLERVVPTGKKEERLALKT
jgi:hypothetical protein